MGGLIARGLRRLPPRASTVDNDGHCLTGHKAWYTWNQRIMGLLEKTNPRATLQSVVLRAIQAAAMAAVPVVPVVILVRQWLGIELLSGV